jgi:hypothetical protein
MKKSTLAGIATLFWFLVQGQELNKESIDSIAERHEFCKTILLFSKIHDTIDNQTGQIYTQRISIYYDRIHKQLRDIDVYNFKETLKPEMIQRIFRKQKKIPPATHIVYTFLNCNLIKVKLSPPSKDCKECMGEYYFNGDTLISKNEKNIVEPRGSFVAEARFYFSKLETQNSFPLGCMR